MDKIKKPFKRLLPEGLHPVYLALVLIARSLSHAELRQIGKAGLLAPPPFQQPSHPDWSKQWHSRLKGFSLCMQHPTKRTGIQRRDRSRL